jgi:thiol-disulfide isomerase/thioredoxin
MRLFILCILMFFAAGTVPLSQAAEVAYTQTAFDAAVKEGRAVAVVFHANWCPTCRAQAPVLKQLMLEPKFKNLTLFVADYDKEKALEHTLHVTQQSTIVVFKGGAEITRSTGETTQDSLAAVLSKAATGV